MLKIRKISKNLLKLLEGHLGLIVLLIFITALLYAAFIFYNYAYKTILTPAEEVFYKKVRIEKAVFERIMEDLGSREERILEAVGKEYKDVFR